MRALGQTLLVIAITVALGELGARTTLGLHPLSIEPTVWEAHPTRGWAHRPGARERFVRLGFEQPIEINERGLRERDIPYERAPSVARVLVIGDSGVASFEVAPEEVFTRVMERALRRRGIAVEVINGGCRGYGTGQSLLFLREEGMRYSPDLVLYRWSPTDAEDNVTVHKAFRRFGKGYFDLDEFGHLTLRGVPVPEYPYAQALRVGPDGELHEGEVSLGLRARILLRDHGAGRSALAASLLHLATVAPELADRIASAGSTAELARAPALGTGSRAFRVTAAQVAAMREEARAGGARFATIGPDGLWPRALRAELGLVDLGDWSAYRARIPAGLKVTAPYDSHMNAPGHALFGEVLAEAVVERELLPGLRARAR